MSRRWLVLMLVLASACSTGRARPVQSVKTGATEEGVASWYGPGFHGNATSSGEIYDQFDLTAAHRTLPLGTRVAVTCLDNGRSVEVRINDRGPFVNDRIIDLSYAAARQLGMIGPGTSRVRLEVLGSGTAVASRADTRSMPVVRYAVQVGAFSDARNAERLRQQLQPQFEEVYVSTLDADAGRYYRVRLGRFNQREIAVSQARQAASLGLTAVIVEDGGH